MKTISDLSPEQLRQAARIKEQINSLEKQMRAMLGQAPASAPAKKGGLSDAAKAKISAAAKARWAKIKAGQAKSGEKTAPAAAPKKKTMSAAQKAKIAATLRARWAKIKAAKAGK